MKKLLLLAILAVSFGIRAQTIESITPNSANAGETLQVTITGNGTNFSSISTVVFYNGSIEFYVSSINVISNTLLNAMVTIPDSAPTGSYHVIEYGEVDSIELSNGFFVTNNNNVITGNIRVDVDGNGCSGSDGPVAGVKVSLNNGASDSYTFTNNVGNYFFYVPAGDYTVTPAPELPYYVPNPASGTINFASTGNFTQTQDFCLTPSGVHNDLSVTILTLMPARPGFDASYRIVYKNNGNQTLSGTVNFTFDDARLDFVSASVPPSQTTNNLSWAYADLLPFETRIVEVVLNVNSPMETPAVNINDILPFSATVNPVSGDENPGDNTANLNQVVVGSFDPNDKAVAEGSQINISNIGDYLHYFIRFQNSGTFAAENVRVQDMLSSNLDLSTLEVVSASHPYRSTLTSGNKLEFFFDNINLPPESQDEPGSHGFIAFKIKPASTVGIGSAIENTAEIYFDFNFPIVTNTVQTTVTVLGNSGFGFDNQLLLSPNPIKDIGYVKSAGVISKIRVVNIFGQTLIETAPNHTEAAIDLSGFAKGVYFIVAESHGKPRHLKIIKD